MMSWAVLFGCCMRAEEEKSTVMMNLAGKLLLKAATAGKGISAGVWTVSFGRQ